MDARPNPTLQFTLDSAYYVAARWFVTSHFCPAPVTCGAFGIGLVLCQRAHPDWAQSVCAPDSYVAHVLIGKPVIYFSGTCAKAGGPSHACDPPPRLGNSRKLCDARASVLQPPRF